MNLFGTNYRKQLINKTINIIEYDSVHLKTIIIYVFIITTSKNNVTLEEGLLDVMNLVALETRQNK